MEKYSIISTNCDCCSAIIARPTGKFEGVRCPDCKRPLGIMQYKIIVENIKAEYPEDAIKKYRAK